FEYRFDDKIRTTANNSSHEEWRTMTSENGRSTFTSGSRVKLPLKKPIVFGVINYFRTEVDDDGEEGPKKDMVCLQRFPKEILGDGDAASKLYPVTELDPHKSLMKEDDWNKAMSTMRKVLPVSLDVTPRPVPESLTIRTGESKLTRANVRVKDGHGKFMVEIPQGKALRVIEVLERVGEDGETEPVLRFLAKPSTRKQHEKMYCFEPMDIEEPGDYTWTVAVVKEGTSINNKPEWLLAVTCNITVLPGNPTKSVLEGDEWDI
ncbi:unnamed protein product, partial [Ectocarpus sp. 12 AP-2014]